MTENPPPEVVVAGGGIAALELVLALREHAGDRVRITVVAPERDFVPRPMLVAEPLHAADAAPRRALREIADDAGFTLVPGAVASVDSERRRVVLGSGATLNYDTLVLAPGVRRLPAFEDAIHIGDDGAAHALERLREEIHAGSVSNVAFVAPTLTGWLLPLYEAALLTAEIDERVLVSLFTPEERPLALFGEQASARVEDELVAAGVEFVGGVHGLGEAEAEADRIVSLPLLRGPRIEGLPTSGLYGLIPVDDYGRVTGLDATYAVGDATVFPIKQGGLACQQADAAAAHIAARHGAAVTPEPFRPELRAVLITGRGEAVPLGAGPVSGKLPGRYLAPYLTAAATA